MRDHDHHNGNGDNGNGGGDGRRGDPLDAAMAGITRLAEAFSAHVLATQEMAGIMRGEIAALRARIVALEAGFDVRESVAPLEDRDNEA